MRKALGTASIALALVLAGCDSKPEGPDGGLDGAGIASGDAQTDGFSDTRNAYFGDLHIHTGNSFDAYIFNVRSKPEDVYKFAIGEKVAHPSGYEIEIDGPPLDFVAATDHGSYMGILPEMNTARTDLNKLEMAQDMFSDDQEKIIAAFGRVGASVRSGEPLPGALDKDCPPSAFDRQIGDH